MEYAMKAVCWMGKSKLETLTVPDPTILNPHDAIIKVTRTAICGSDLHLFDGFIPTMESGDILGHEFMGLVEEVGPNVTNLKRGDRVVVPFTIACGSCEFCKKRIWAACDNTNPNAPLMEAAYGYSGSGLFGYSHMMGGYAGGQAQYVRVPFANVGPLKLETDLADVTVDYSQENVSVLAALKDLTGGIGPDACIDAVGLESHTGDLQGAYDTVKNALLLETDRPAVLRQAIQAVRKGGTLSIPGVYGGMLDKVPFGAAFAKGITMKMGQTNMHNYMKPLLERIEKGQIDPSYIISHRISLDEAPEMYKVWRDKEDRVTKIVIDPWVERRAA
jgi:threonine dehydrogenase-like Zn-dependent dehydrogenase